MASGNWVDIGMIKTDFQGQSYASEKVYLGIGTGKWCLLKPTECHVNCKTEFFLNLEKQLRSNTIAKHKEHEQHSKKNISFFAFKWHGTNEWVNWTQGGLFGFIQDNCARTGQEYQTEGLSRSQKKKKKNLTANKDHTKATIIYIHTQLLCYSTSHKHDARTEKIMTTFCTSVKRLSTKTTVANIQRKTSQL